MLSLFVVIGTLSIMGALINAKQELINIDPELAGPIFAAVSKCMAQTKLSPYDLQKAKEGIMMKDDEETFKKFLFCTYQETGYAYPNGRLNVEKAALLFPKEFNIKTIIDKCDKDDKDPVETVYSIHKCFRKNSPAILRYK